MAMGHRGRREAEYAIASCRPFQNSTGSFYGTRGNARRLGWLENHADARLIRELLSRAVYVVWSYGTPISWVSEDEDGNRTAYYVDETHSATTSNHQGIARGGMGEYVTIGLEARRERERENRRQAAERRRVAQDRQEHGLRVVGQAEVESALRTNHRGVQYDPAVERDTSYDRDMAEASSPGYQNGRTESQQQATLQQLLDPRYADPDWTPFGPLDPEAERRDAERVERERVWRP